MSTIKKKLVVIGISGASCSGKTLLAKSIRSVLPDALLLHQDDFAPHPDQVPHSSLYPDLQDWDDPPTCILWPKFREALKHVRNTGELPPLHQSHDHLNASDGPQIAQAVKDKWSKALRELEAEQKEHGVQIQWCLVEGFVLYWDQDVVDALDVRLFLRVPHATLKRRRDNRSVYIMQNPDAAAAGGVWTDPPNYFDKVVYPAYVKGHKRMFEGEDVENGAEREEWRDKVKMVMPGEGLEEVTRVFEESCGYLVEQVRGGTGVAL